MKRVMKTRVPLWRDYFTQEQIKSAVRTVLASYLHGEEFESELISDLIAERHYFCSVQGFRPLKFKKGFSYGSQLHGYFDGIGWHPVSWEKCAGKPPTVRDHINKALRLRIKAEKDLYLSNQPTCEYCHSNPSEEVHHETPEWREIMDMILSEVLPAEVDAVMESWNWFHKDEFQIPDGSAIAIVFDRIHETAVLKSLCKRCHDATKKQKRAV